MADGYGKPLVFEDQKDIKGIVEVAAKYGIGKPVPIGAGV